MLRRLTGLLLAGVIGISLYVGIAKADPYPYGRHGDDYHGRYYGREPYHSHYHPPPHHWHRPPGYYR